MAARNKTGDWSCGISTRETAIIHPSIHFLQLLVLHGAMAGLEPISEAIGASCGITLNGGPATLEPRITKY